MSLNRRAFVRTLVAAPLLRIAVPAALLPALAEPAMKTAEVLGIMHKVGYDEWFNRSLVRSSCRINGRDHYTMITIKGNSQADIKAAKLRAESIALKMLA